MANFSLVHLLKYDPFEALLIAYNDVHGTSLNPRYVMLDSVTPSLGRDVTVRLKARPDIPNEEEKKFSNVGEITVRRLDLTALFGEQFELEHVGEVVSHDVAKVIARVTGIVFDQNDFIDDVITIENNVLKASPVSLRWHGTLVINNG
ncbi:hypothetical protein D3C85_16230 [compost metagenome]